MRANQISDQFVKKSRPQDLLHMFGSLGKKGDYESSIKTVERMAKLAKFGSEEISSMRKLCKWSPTAFKKLIDVLKKFEIL